MNREELIELLETEQEYLFTLIVGIFLVCKNTKKAIMIDKSFLRLYHNEERDFDFLMSLGKRLDLVIFQNPSFNSDKYLMCTKDTFSGLPKVYDLYELLGYNCSIEKLDPSTSKFVGYIEISLQTDSLSISKIFNKEICPAEEDHKNVEQKIGFVAIDYQSVLGEDFLVKCVFNPETDLSTRITKIETGDLGWISENMQYFLHDLTSFISEYSNLADFFMESVNDPEEFNKYKNFFVALWINFVNIPRIYSTNLDSDTTGQLFDEHVLANITTFKYRSFDDCTEILEKMYTALFKKKVDMDYSCLKCARDFMKEDINCDWSGCENLDRRSKKLLLKYHPDKNNNDERCKLKTQSILECAEKLKTSDSGVNCLEKYKRFFGSKEFPSLDEIENILSKA